MCSDNKTNIFKITPFQTIKSEIPRKRENADLLLNCRGKMMMKTKMFTAIFS